VDVIAMGRCCSAHTGNEVSSCVGSVAAWPRRSCVCFGLEEVVLLKWDCLYKLSVDASQYLLENGGP
jgi:hypothetical protein